MIVLSKDWRELWVLAGGVEISVVDVGNGRVIRRVQDLHRDPVFSILLIDEGDKVLTVSRQGGFKVWSAIGWEVEQEVENRGAAISDFVGI